MLESYFELSKYLESFIMIMNKNKTYMT